MRHPIEIFAAGVAELANWIESYWWATIAVMLAPLVLPVLMRSKLAFVWVGSLLGLALFMLFARIMYWWAPWLAAWPISILVLSIDHMSKIATQRHQDLLQAIRESKNR